MPAFRRGSYVPLDAPLIDTCLDGRSPDLKGKVRDIYVEPVATPTDDGFTVERAEVVFRGRCAQCQS